MICVNTAMEQLSVGTAGLVAVLGYLVVFIGLVALMVVIMIEGKIMAPKKKAAEMPIAAPAENAPVISLKPLLPEAPGSVGDCKLFDVDDRTAAMLMAIVANKTGKPLNTLRFKSIKEVK